GVHRAEAGSLGPWRRLLYRKPQRQGPSVRSLVVSSVVSLLRRLGRVRFALIAIAVVLGAPVVAVVVASFFTPLPPELAVGRPPATGTVLRDRGGVVLRELLAD